MQAIHLKPTGDEAWPELAEHPENVIDLTTDDLHAAFLDNGTIGGQPVVILRADQDDKSYIIQITGRQFQALYHAFKGKYGIIE